MVLLSLLGASRPLLLLLDGHSSYYNTEAISLARENDVIVFTLVLHTTHELQPLDTAVFGQRIGMRSAINMSSHIQEESLQNTTLLRFLLKHG